MALYVKEEAAWAAYLKRRDGDDGTIFPALTARELAEGPDREFTGNGEV